MKQSMRVLLLSSVAVTAHSITAVEKVVKMLEDMKEKAIAEKNAEEVQYSKYKQWCGMEQDTKKSEIEDLQDKIESDTADMDAALTEADNLAKGIAELIQTRTDLENDKAVAIKTRATEKAAFDKLYKDLSESIYATTKAEEVLAKELSSQESKGEALALLSKSTLISKADSAKVEHYLKGNSAKAKATGDDLDLNLDVSTSGIKDLLQKLKGKFKDDRVSAEQDELDKKNTHTKLVAELKNSIETAIAGKNQKTQEKSKQEAIAAQKKSDIADDTSTKTDTTKYLQETTDECDRKAKDFASRTELRTGEIDAITQAVTIIGGKEVEKAEQRKDQKKEKESYKKKTALASLRSAVRSPNMEHVANFLYGLADKYSSSLLSTTAARVEKDPLTKVRDMLQTLVTRLEEEMRSSASKNEWCTSEIRNNKKARTDATNEVERYTAELDDDESKVAMLNTEISELKNSLEVNQKNLDEATKTRNAENAENTGTISDAKDAQDAVSSAMKILKEFYIEADKSTALAQASMKNKQKPEIFDKEYKGQQEKGGGVAAMLNVILSDYKKLEDDVSMSEEAAHRAFTTMSQDAAALKAQQEKDVEHKSAEVKRTETAMTNLRSDLETSQKELKAGEEYYTKLKETCLADGPTHEERQERRKQEIDSLTEALTMLSEE
eukprot:TRINITY_DN20_c0_g1_i3.p1 TRINITY_DN20_c0_g1~~TRINITY_DN20_c0_g1_i3.p1  ORF type:complete len:668 (+),score=236.38 TRINITY_DN20_c0_g1_i3:92-2095(+)